MADRTMGLKRGDMRGQLKVVLELGAPNAYEIHGIKTYLNLEDQDERKLLSVDMACPNEGNKTEKQAEVKQKY